jgi:putative hydroxymethylpyrimidine transport system ATP-binding protein
MSRAPSPSAPSPSIDSQSPRPPGVRVRGGRLAFGGEVVFDDLAVDLAAGSWTCLLGPSGIGKTSLIRMIAGLVPTPPATLIECDDGGPLAGRVAYMAQADLLMPWLSLIDNVTIGARLRGGRRAGPDLVSRARELLDRVGLGARADDPPAACSAGMRQCVALARTLLEDRPVVLMDEPFSALDAITRVRLQTLAAELLAGRTVLLVTHDPLEALRLGHDIHVMSGRPARLDEALTPDGAPPRDPTDRSLIARHGELLSRLLAASTA